MGDGVQGVRERKFARKYEGCSINTRKYAAILSMFTKNGTKLTHNVAQTVLHLQHNFDGITHTDNGTVIVMVTSYRHNRPNVMQRRLTLRYHT